MLLESRGKIVCEKMNPPTAKISKPLIANAVLLARSTLRTRSPLARKRATTKTKLPHNAARNPPLLEVTTKPNAIIARTTTPKIIGAFPLAFLRSRSTPLAASGIAIAQ